jgi:RNA polymerase sigma-70 factor (ECF subfamily)
MWMKVVKSVLLPGSRAGLERTRWLGALVQAQQGALVRAVVAEGLQAHEALDLVQDSVVTFLAHVEWAALRDRPDEAGRLLAALVRNRARNARRRHSRQDLSLSADEVAAPAAEAQQLDAALDQAEAHVALTGCLSTLKQTQRAVVVARFLDERSGVDVAAQLGLSPGHVAVILHRARQQLRSCLEASRERFGVSAE